MSTVATGEAGTAEAPHDGGPLLEARGLSAGYGALAAVRDLDLQVSAGEVVALLGANGAGKTTTLLTLAGEIQPMAGEVRWLGKRSTSPLFRRAREGLALVTEEKSVFMRLTARENLGLGRGEVEEAVELFPELREHLDRVAGVLSGGQLQMLTVARALAGQPKVLLADELSLGLAPLMVQRLLVAVKSAAANGVGVVLVEQHVRQALKVADTVYVLQRGRVVFRADADSAMAQIDQIEKAYLEGGATDGGDQPQTAALAGRRPGQGPLRKRLRETLRPMDTFESPELLELYQTYTAHPGSIAAHFNTAAAWARAENPLVVGTGTDIAVFRGGGAAPVVERIRTATGGFKELAGISHLGPAVAAVMAMKRIDPDGPWRADAERLIASVRSRTPSEFS